MFALTASQAGSFVIGVNSDKNSLLLLNLVSQHPVVKQHGNRRAGKHSDFLHVILSGN